MTGFYCVCSLCDCVLQCFILQIVHCNKQRRHMKLEISWNNYHGILRLHQRNIREFCFLEMLGTLYQFLCFCFYHWPAMITSRLNHQNRSTNCTNHIFQKASTEGGGTCPSHTNICSNNNLQEIRPSLPRGKTHFFQP